MMSSGMSGYELSYNRGRTLNHEQDILAVSVVPCCCSAHCILQTAKDGMYIGCMGGTDRTFACKNASGKIGIFDFVFSTMQPGMATQIFVRG